VIHRVKIFRVNPDLTFTQVLTFRMAGTQDDAEALGHQLQSRWLELNPGHGSVMVTDWPRPAELGDTYASPSPGDRFYVTP
jgi:hypothetical protein